MNIKLFTIPITGVSDYEAELNTFLSTHKVIEVEKHLVQTATGAYWCLYISYMEQTVSEKARKGKIDYMVELDTATFAKFSNLRKARKQIAEKESVSAFIVFSDAELAEMAKLPELSLSKMKAIKGVGKAKSEKYGQPLLDIYQGLQEN
jgi:superfamily II DNA helicase RecQ